MSKKLTLKEFLHSLFEMAYYHDKEGKRGKVKNPTMKNFLNEHDLLGTLRGSPHWRRNENYYSRGKKSYSTGCSTSRMRRAGG